MTQEVADKRSAALFLSTGFATTQMAYEEAFHEVFAMLDELEQRFPDGRNFLSGGGGPPRPMCGSL